MKLRRTFLAFVVLAGCLVLILGITGVFSAREPKPAAPPASEPESGRMQAVVKSFRTEGESWTLAAAEARLQEDTGAQLVRPRLEVRQPGSDGGRLAVTADEGVAENGPPQSVQMSGHVEVEFSGRERGTLSTRSLKIEPAERSGRTADEVTVVMETQEGRQRLTGKGAEFALKQRRIVVAENVRMELTGAGGDIFPRAGGAPAGTAAPARATEAVCRGPATADGFRRTVELNGDVRVRRGEDALRADRVEARFAEKGRGVERFVAEGGVTFRTGGAEGACDRLVRNSLDDELLLEGRPARVRRGASEIEAARIELSGAKGAITVPVPGRLTLAQEGAAASEPPASVQWSDRLQFDPAEHRAVFRGGVRFTQGGRTIECRTLSVKLDPDNRRVVECRAETDVRLTGQMGGPQSAADTEPVLAQGKELLYDPETSSAVLSGDATVRQGGRMIRGERIELRSKDAAVDVAVPGAGSLEGRAPDTAEGFSISWNREMRFSRASQDAAFRRGVSLRYGEDTVRADSLNARVGDHSLQGFDAGGGVTLEQRGGSARSGMTLSADNLAGDLGRDRKIQRLDATGHVVIREDAQPGRPSRVLTADRVVSTPDAKGGLQGYEATGHVVLVQDADAGGDRLTMKAERAVAKLDAQNRLAGIEAFGGPVTVEKSGQFARGDRLVWDALTQKGVLSGSPAELRQGTSRLLGDQVEFSQKDGGITVTSRRRVEASIVGAERMTSGTLP